MCKRQEQLSLRYGTNAGTPFGRQDLLAEDNSSRRVRHGRWMLQRGQQGEDSGVERAALSMPVGEGAAKLATAAADSVAKPMVPFLPRWQSMPSTNFRTWTSMTSRSWTASMFRFPLLLPTPSALPLTAKVT